jgi:hypothetical protein
MAYLRARRGIRAAPRCNVKLNECRVGITAGTGDAQYPVNTSGGRTVASLSWMATVAMGAFGVCLLVVSGSAASARTWRADGRVSSGLVYSRASNSVVQHQPAPDSCHAVGSSQYSRPDPRCTPGALNPSVRQDNINETICKSGWTHTIRPPEYITEDEKRLSMAAYGDQLAISNYEYDHFVPLELGGATNDPRNLWPEPGASPNPKDAVEDYLNREVCDHKMTLAHAQSEIVANWVVIYRQLNRPSNPTRPAPRPTTKPPAPPPPPSATCSANAQWSNEYDDYDVYVSSNQPDKKVSVTGAGTSASWYTDSSGNADVYFRAGHSAAGDQVTVSVGAATCYATL